MQKFYALFLVPVIVTSCSYTMDREALKRSGVALSKFINIFHDYQHKESEMPHETMYVFEDEESSSEEDWLDQRVDRVFSSLEDPYESVSGSSIRELEQVLRGAPQEALDILETFLNPRGEIDRAALLVGEPGVGKTTLAKSMAYLAHKLKGWTLVFYSSTDFGSSNDQRNSSGNRLRETLEAIVARNKKAIVILDEIDKILENHNSTHHDTGYMATGLWAFLDRQRHKGNFYLIGTANRVDSIPEPFKERVYDTTIVLPEPTPEMRRKIFRAKIDAHRFIILDPVCDNIFFDEFLGRLEGWSGRRLEKIINKAEKIAHRPHRGSKKPSLVKQEHFEAALSTLTEVGDKTLKIGHQKESQEEIQNRMHEENKEMHKENIKMQKKNQELQDQHFAQNAYIQISQSKQSSLGGNGGLSVGVGTLGLSANVSAGGSYASQSITQDGIDGIIRMLTNKQKVFICNQFEADFRKQCKIVNDNMASLITKIRDLKNKNLKELTTNTATQLATLKNEFKTIQSKFNVSKASLDINEVSTIAVSSIRILAQKVLDTIPNGDSIKQAEKGEKVRQFKNKKMVRSTNFDVDLSQDLLDGKLLDDLSNATSAPKLQPQKTNNSWCVIL